MKCNLHSSRPPPTPTFVGISKVSGETLVVLGKILYRVFFFFEPVILQLVFLFASRFLFSAKGSSV